MLFTSPLPPLPSPQRHSPPADCRQRPAPAYWPFGELTQEQRLSRQKQEARMRADLLLGLPSCFGEPA